MLLSVTYFAFMNVFAKLLSHFSAFQVVSSRAVFALVLGWLILRRDKVVIWNRPVKLLLLRGFFGTLALCLYFYTLQTMPLATAVVLHHMSPLFTLLMARFFEGDRVSKSQWGAFLLAFAGVAFVRGFDAQVTGLGISAAIGAAFFSALAYQMIRKTKDSVPPMLIVFYFALIATVVAVPPTIYLWKSPTWIEWIWMLGVGVTTFFAQVALTKAYQSSKAKEVSQFIFLGVIFALIFGLIIFDEKLSIGVWIGISLVLTGVILASKLAQIDRRKQAQEIPLKISQP